MEEKLVWKLISYIFQSYESYEIKFPTIISFSYSTLILKIFRGSMPPDPLAGKPFGLQRGLRPLETPPISTQVRAWVVIDLVEMRAWVWGKTGTVIEYKVVSRASLPVHLGTGLRSGVPMHQTLPNCSDFRQMSLAPKPWHWLWVVHHIGLT